MCAHITILNVAQHPINTTVSVHPVFPLQKAELKQCDKNVFLIKSANQQIFEYYHDITASQLKAYALVQLSYMFFTVYGRGNFRNAAEALRTKYLDQSHETQGLVKNLLNNSMRDIWRCDPNRFSIGMYEEVTNFLQGYIDNEVNLNAEETCQNTCSDYQSTRSYGCTDGTYCAQKAEGAERDRARCNGRVVDCQFLGSDLNVCSNVSLPPPFAIEFRTFNINKSNCVVEFVLQNSHMIQRDATTFFIMIMATCWAEMESKNLLSVRVHPTV